MAQLTKRVACLSAVLVCGVVALLMVAFVGSAAADSWVVEGGVHYLKNPEGEVIRSWTAREWKVWAKEVEAVGECLGIAEGCAGKLFGGETAVERLSPEGAEEAQKGVEALRMSFGSLGVVEEHLDRLGFDVGSLPTDLGFGVVSHAKLVHGPVVVEFGSTGVQQGYEVRADPPLSKKEEEEEIEVPHEGLVEHLIGPESNVTQVEQCLALPTETCGVVKEYPAGTYFLSLSGQGDHFGLTEEQEVCESGNIKAGTCKGRKTEVRQHYEGWTVPPGWERYETLVSEGYIVGGVYAGDLGRTKVVFVTKEALECGKAPSGHECTLLGLPAPGRLTAELEKHNGWNGLEPKAKEAFTPHMAPPTSLTEAELEELSEENATRSQLEALFKQKGREEVELEVGEEEGFGNGNEGEPGRVECHSGKPVNCATGNESERQVDLSLGGRGPSLELALTYNSMAADKGRKSAFGCGWTSSLEPYVQVAVGGTPVVVHQGNGSTVMFWHGEGGKWETYPGLVEATLASEGSGYAYTLPNQTTLHFNSSGTLTSEVDRNGNALTMNRNAEGRLESVSDTAGRKITLKYNAEGLVESASDPMGHTVSYTYEGGNLATVTLPGEESPRWKYEYNAEHDLIEMTDGRKNTTTIKYAPGTGSVVSETDPMKRTREWRISPDFTGYTSSLMLEPNGGQTGEYFNTFNEPIWSVREAGRSDEVLKQYTYNGTGRVVSVENGEKHITEFGYNNSGDRTSEKNPAGDETKWEYDGTHDVIAVTTPDGERTTIERDSHGNPLKVSRPAPGGTTQATKYKYAADGDVESMTDSLGHEWKYEYDSYGDRTGETDPESDKQTWGYNEDSQLTSMVTPRGHAKGAKESSFKTTIERDAQGRVKTIIDPLKHETKYTYDADGNTETLTDPEAEKTTYTYDADDERTKVEEPSKAVRETGYNEEGQVVSQTDGNKHTTKYERNPVGNVTEEVNAVKQKTTKEYNEEGRVTKETDPLGRTTTYKYDPAGNLVEVSYSDGKTPTVKYEYNGDGYRTKMTDGTGETTYTRDQLDRVTESKDGHGDVTKYEYNLGNDPTKITYPNGKAVIREYDGDQRLKAVKDWLENTTSFAYDPDWNLAAVTYPSATGESDTYTYEDDQAMSEAKMSKGGEVLASLAYTRNKDRYMTKATSKGLPGEEKPAFTYDEDSRLTKGAGVAYKYDAANNATTIGTNTYSYNAADELESAANSKKATIDSYTFNEADERTKTTPASGPATTYGYDQAGNLTTVARPKQGEAPAIEDSYGYNGEMLRTSEIISGSTNYLTWNMTEELPTVLSNGTYSIIYGAYGNPVEQISNSTGTVLYLHHDQQGSTRLITSTTGKTEATMTYGAYGETTGHTGTATTPLGFDGQLTNPDTGLIYLRARSYDPATAQFVSRDPLLAITGDPYGYADQNPLNEADPDGRCGFFCVVGIGLGTVSLGTGVGEVFIGGGLISEGVLGGVSAITGLAGAGADAKECASGSGVACIGAGAGIIASGGAGVVGLGLAGGGAAASGATAIGLTSGGIGVLSDSASAIAETSGIGGPPQVGCG